MARVRQRVDVWTLQNKCLAAGKLRVRIEGMLRENCEPTTMYLAWGPAVVGLRQVRNGRPSALSTPAPEGNMLCSITVHDTQYSAVLYCTVVLWHHSARKHRSPKPTTTRSARNTSDPVSTESPMPLLTRAADAVKLRSSQDTFLSGMEPASTEKRVLEPVPRSYASYSADRYWLPDLTLRLFLPHGPLMSRLLCWH
ncbi:hypothetical protein OPT61_g5969 [Boeremia exigua]|uniref:Uncharacterized protein n=1 Tax=Boeremia exigua TaxID=749465 RepID=A0ACC2I8G8_9PLEO|nr:hypothetical protein OPT61_g5969 [Boeremia exigua]